MWSIGLLVALDNVIAGLVVEATVGDVAGWADFEPAASRV
jgi:hypothetical protein